jgi:hypothetical protein
MNRLEKYHHLIFAVLLVSAIGISSALVFNNNALVVGASSKSFGQCNKLFNEAHHGNGTAKELARKAACESLKPTNSSNSTD